MDPINVETPQVRRLTLTVGEASQVLGVSRSSAYELVRRGELPSMRLGRRIVIPVRALDPLLNRVAAEVAGWICGHGSGGDQAAG